MKTIDAQTEINPLVKWRQRSGVTRYWVVKQLKCSYVVVQKWEENVTLPTLVYAFKLEAITRGGVPASSWLTSKCGQRRLNNLGVDEEAAKDVQYRKHKKFIEKRKQRALEQAAVPGNVILSEPNNVILPTDNISLDTSHDITQSDISPNDDI